MKHVLHVYTFEPGVVKDFSYVFEAEVSVFLEHAVQKLLELFRDLGVWRELELFV